MAIAVTTAVTALRTSLRNADRQMELDRVGALARRKMDELLAERLNPRCQGFGGVFPAALAGGVEAGWSAVATPYENGDDAAPGLALPPWSASSLRSGGKR